MSDPSQDPPLSCGTSPSSYPPLSPQTHATDPTTPTPHTQPESPTPPSQTPSPQHLRHKHKNHHGHRRFKQTIAHKQDDEAETYPLGTPMPYEYKAKEWQKKTPKMVVNEFFQRYQVKDSLKWERINLPSSKKHLVKCVFPAEFGSKEFVPNHTWNSVKDAEHNTAILALLYLNSVPEGSGNQDVKVPLSDFIPPPLPVSDNTRKQMAYLKYKPGFKRKTPDSDLVDNPNRIGIGQYSAVPPPEQVKQQLDSQHQRLAFIRHQQVFNQEHQRRLAHGSTYIPQQESAAPTNFTQYAYPYPNTTYQSQQSNSAIQYYAATTNRSAYATQYPAGTNQYFAGLSNTNFAYGYTPSMSFQAQNVGYYPGSSQFSEKR